jgi:hypothetical protein
VQIHQNFFAVNAVTSRGVTFPFIAGCHVRATAGNRVARQFVIETRSLAQNGQSTLARDLLWTGLSHS